MQTNPVNTASPLDVPAQADFKVSGARKFFSLVKVMLKNNQTNAYLTGGRKKILGLDPDSKTYRVLKAVLYSLLFILVTIYSVVIGLTVGLAISEYHVFVTGLMKLSIMLILLMGLYTSATTLFFARDLPCYLTFPIKPSTLVGAKFLTYCISMFSLIIFFVPAVLAVGIVGGTPLPKVLGAALLVIISVVPTLCVVVLITFALLRFTPLGKSKDRFQAAYGIITLIVTMALLYLYFSSGVAYNLGNLQAGVEVTAATSIFNGPVVTALVAILSPGILLTEKFLTSTGAASAGWWFATFAIAALYIVVLLLVARKNYLPAALEIQSAAGGGGKLLSASEVTEKIKRTSALKSFLATDWKRTSRSPMMFQQYILAPVLVPLIVGVSFFFSLKYATKESGVEFDFFTAGQYLANPEFASYGLSLGLPVAMGTGLFFGVFSGYAMSAISLEGTDFLHLKTFPVNYRIYLLSKLLLSLCIGAFPPMVVLFIFMLVVKVPVGLALLYLVYFLLGNIISQGLLIFFDVVSPKLDWENETQLKNRVLRMYVAMMVPSVLAVLIIAPAAIMTFAFSATVLPIVVSTLIGLFLLVLVGILLFVAGPIRLQKIEV